MQVQDTGRGRYRVTRDDGSTFEVPHARGNRDFRRIVTPALAAGTVLPPDPPAPEPDPADPAEATDQLAEALLAKGLLSRSDLPDRVWDGIDARKAARPERPTP